MGTVKNASLPAWGGWIEIPITRQDMATIVSLPAWGGWIEI